MTKDVVKGKVKRLLRDQEDMGQLSETALLATVSAMEAFVQDIGRRLVAQASAAHKSVITPVELKQSVLSSPDLAFLQNKVRAIDETDAKYHKTPRKRRTPAKTAGASATDATATQRKRQRRKDSGTSSQPAATKERQKSKAPMASEAQPAAVESSTRSAEALRALESRDDDGYDDSDSDSE